MGRCLGLMLSLSGTVAAAAPTVVSVAPAELVLGRGGTAEVKVAADPAHELRALASVGSLEPTGTSGQEHRFRYTPPASRFPQRAVLLFWLETGAVPEVASAQIRLHGRTDLQATTEPGATVRVEVEQSVFGPEKADARGKVTVPIEVPPGTTTAIVVAETKRKSTRREVPLAVPRASPVSAAFSPETVSAKTGGWLVVAHGPDQEASKLVLELDGARAELVSAAGAPAVFHIVPAEGSAEVAVKLTAPGEGGGTAAARADIEKPAEPPPPAAPRDARPELGAFAGGFYAGGANTGWTLGATAAVEVPPLHPVIGDRLALEANVGARRSGLSVVTTLGKLDSALLAVPIGVALRVRAYQHGAAAVYGRVGGGLVPFRHSIAPAFGTAFAESAIAAEGYAALQVGYRLGPIEVVAEARGTLSSMRTAHLDADGGGLGLSAGARGRLP